MSNEHGEKRNRKQPLPQNSFTSVLEKLGTEDYLRNIHTAAQESAETSISICRATQEDNSQTLFFVVDTRDNADLPALGEQVEDILDYPNIEIIRQRSVSLTRFNAMYKNVTSLAPENKQQVQAFIDEVAGPSKKMRN